MSEVRPWYRTKLKRKCSQISAIISQYYNGKRLLWPWSHFIHWKNENIVILLEDKEWCTVILNITDYTNKANAMIEDGIINGKYVETINSRHQDLKRFQDFLYRNFYWAKYYAEIYFKFISFETYFIWNLQPKHTNLKALKRSMLMT